VILLPTVYHSIDLTLVQIPGIVLLVHIIANIVTTSINPAEPAVLRKLQSGHRLRPIFDRSVHKHVIEDWHCHLCEVDVSLSAKHCGLCDKCVMDFDHHCKWLNNCVGAANYRLILSMSSWVLFMATLVKGGQPTGDSTIRSHFLVLSLLYFSHSCQPWQNPGLVLGTLISIQASGILESFIHA